MRTGRPWGRALFLALMSCALTAQVIDCDHKAAALESKAVPATFTVLATLDDPIVFGAVPDVARDDVLPLVELTYSRGTGLAPGKIRISGEFARIDPDSALPAKLRVIVEQRNASDDVVATRRFDLRVKRRTGVIRAKTFSFPLMVVDATDRVIISLQPLGGDLDEAGLTVDWRYTAS